MVKRGEVYFIDLDPTIGHEQRGRRPVVVVSNNSLNNQPLVVMVVPGTKRRRSPIPYLGTVIVPSGEAGLSYETIFLTFQARAVDHGRFSDSAQGSLSERFLESLDVALRWTLALEGPQS